MRTGRISHQVSARERSVILIILKVLTTSVISKESQKTSIKLTINTVLSHEKIVPAFQVVKNFKTTRETDQSPPNTSKQCLCGLVVFSDVNRVDEEKYCLHTELVKGIVLTVSVLTFTI
jgi:hypothetical protein